MFERHMQIQRKRRSLCIQCTFSCASERAYTAAVFDQDGSITTRLIAFKTCLAPLKTLSIPRLELLGALIEIKSAQRSHFRLTPSHTGWKRRWGEPRIQTLCCVPCWGDPFKFLPWPMTLLTDQSEYCRSWYEGNDCVRADRICEVERTWLSTLSWSYMARPHVWYTITWSTDWAQINFLNTEYRIPRISRVQQATTSFSDRPKTAKQRQISSKKQSCV